MTEKYYREPYLKSFETKIIEITPKGLILEDTIFYPEGGGSSGDRGLINNVEVLDTQKIDGKIVHILKDTASFNIGDDVSLSLKWSFRYNAMQQHTAQHLISGIMFTDFNIATVAIHIGDEIITIETSEADIDEKTMLLVEDRANEEIRKDKKVIVEEVSHEEAEKRGLRREIKVAGDVRIVTIENVDQIACGGLHVASLAEIEEVVYSGFEKIRGHIRTIWKVARSAKKERRDNKEIVTSLSHLLSSKKEDIVENVEILLNNAAELKKEKDLLLKEVASFTLSEKLSKGEKVFISDLPLNIYQDSLKMLPIEEKVIILSSINGNVTWLIHSTIADFNELKSNLKDFDLRGGGKESVFQGKIANGDLDSFKKAIIEIL